MANVDFINQDHQSFFGGTEVTALTTSVKLAAEQGILYKGAVLGKVTADNTYKLVQATATDGSQVASLILATPEVDTSDVVDLEVVAFKTGIYNADALYVGEGDEVSLHVEELRTVNIHLKTNY